jgi:hypothetical protein
LLLTTDGPNIAVYGSIMTTFHVVQLLATASTINGTNPSTTEREVACLFVALDAAMNAAMEDYGRLVAAFTNYEEIPEAAAICPFPTTFTRRASPPYSSAFKYIRALLRGNTRDPHCVTFLAQQEDGAKCVVKFSRRYSIEAHVALADQHLAPRLLGFDRLENSDIDMVVMDYVQGVTLWQAKRQDREMSLNMFDDLGKALQVLHEKKHVFGDLRDTNVMILDNAGAHRVNLVDFDWAGEHDKSTYPQMNMIGIKWADGMKRGAPMQMEHDHSMLRLLHRQYLDSELSQMKCSCLKRPHDGDDGPSSNKQQKTD